MRFFAPKTPLRMTSCNSLKCYLLSRFNSHQITPRSVVIIGRRNLLSLVERGCEMATELKTPAAPVKRAPEKKGRDQQLRHDRIAAAVVITLFVALMALLIWLASLNGGAPEGIDYWPMMP